jgi:tRNA-specific 2-thiouridylase
LKPVSQDESQDVCFIHDHTYGDFLKQQGLPSTPGPIVDLQDNILGEHQGLHLFTIGQRRGINCPAPYPYYVVKIDTDHNRLVVGKQEALRTDRCRVEVINWIQPPPTKSIKVHTRVRYRHTAAASTLVPIGKQNAEIIFDVPQKALTPGQGAVFYADDEVLGGGWIGR